jgi:hypothetical protein
MSSETRKARVKILKRILNSLAVEINELKLRGESDIDELENARTAITKFCDKLWPFSMDSSKVRHTHYGSRDYHHNPQTMMRAA